jgi:hypothetical protein
MSFIITWRMHTYLPPIASISSKKMMQAFFVRAISKSSLTILAPCAQGERENATLHFTINPLCKLHELCDFYQLVQPIGKQVCSLACESQNSIPPTPFFWYIRFVTFWKLFVQKLHIETYMYIRIKCLTNH